MNEHLIADLNRFVDDHAVTLSESPGHVRLNVVRPEVSVSILIPRTVLEWWVEIIDRSTDNKIEDWCDYAGYDAGDRRELSESMRADVVRFIENVLARPLRFPVSRRILEWHVGKSWFQAVPFVREVAQGTAGDSRNALT
jgi:hypothetical protein